MRTTALVLLIACSNSGQPDPSQHTNTITKDANQPPVAVVEDQSALVGESVTLTGATSFDPEGAALTYTWSLRETPPLSHVTLNDEQAEEVSFTPDRAGYYIVDLWVSDGELASAITTAVVSVFSTDQAPLANAGNDRVVLVGTDVYMSGGWSEDPNDLPLMYDWQIVTAPSGSTAVAAQFDQEVMHFVPDVEGEYVVSLVVHNGSVESTAATATVSAMPEGAIVTGDVPNGVFDPGSVYLFGTVSPGSCGRSAMAHWSDPDVASAGFDCYANESGAKIRFDGTLLYTNTFEDELREFHCDGCPAWDPSQSYPGNVLANDTVVDTSPCDPDDWSNNLNSFLPSPTGQLLYSCGGTWYENGISRAVSSPLSFGHDHRVLSEDEVYDLQTQTSTPIVGLPNGSILASRAQPQGFWVAVSQTLYPELWYVDFNGQTSLVGVYPDVPQSTSAYAIGRLDRNGQLFQEGNGPAVFEDVVIRRNINGLADVVYTEATNPSVQLHISSLVTGP